MKSGIKEKEYEIDRLIDSARSASNVMCEPVASSKRVAMACKWGIGHCMSTQHNVHSFIPMANELAAFLGGRLVFTAAMTVSQKSTRSSSCSTANPPSVRCAATVTSSVRPVTDVNDNLTRRYGA